MNRHYRVLLITTVLAAAASVAAAQPGKDIGQQRMFGKGHPFFVGDLPPGRTREKLESLPAPARRRAMEWLHSFAFPAKDDTAPDPVFRQLGTEPGQDHR